MANKQEGTTHSSAHDVKESKDPASGGKNYDAPDVTKLPPTEKQPEVRTTGDQGQKK